MTSEPGAWIVGASGNFYSHDLAWAVVSPEGKVVRVAEEERFTRIRHSVGALPTVEGLRWALADLSVEPGQVGCIATGIDPDLFEHQYVGEALRRTQDLVFAEAGLGEVPRRNVPHHLAHAASAYYASGFDSAALLTIDGQGECATHCGHAAVGGRIETVWERKHHSLGRLYSQITRWLGLGFLGDEGKTMGLAPYGAPKYLDLFRGELIDWCADDGSFTVHGAVAVSQEALTAVLGPGRRAHEALSDRHKDIAATIQLITEEVVTGLAGRLKEETGSDALCVGGGVGLNAVANGVVARSGLFERFYVPPWAGDAGLSIGAALLAWHAANDTAGDDRTAHDKTGDAQARPVPVYLGQDIATTRPALALQRAAVPFQHVPDPARAAAEALSTGRIVGWCQGRAEVGPRALGNRSILANPAVPGISDRVNNEVKFREPWRPFAPSVLLEDVAKYFELDSSAPYMNVVHYVREKYRPLFPGIVHVDGSARLQTVSAEDNPAYHRLLTHLKELTGHGIVLNTSFNIRGEPIVNSAEQAVHAFLSTDLEVLLMGNLRADKALPGMPPRLPAFNAQSARLRGFADGTPALYFLPRAYVAWGAGGMATDVARRALTNLAEAFGSVRVMTDGPESHARELASGLDGVALAAGTGLRHVFVQSDSTVFSAPAVASLRRLCRQTGAQGYLLVRDRTVHRLSDLEPYLDIWRHAYFTSPPPAGRHDVSLLAEIG